MSIQQSINQAASIGAALYTQTESAAEKKEKKALTREAESIKKGARAMVEAGVSSESAIYQRQRELMKENISQRLRHGLIDDPQKVKNSEKYFGKTSAPSDNDELKTLQYAYDQERAYSANLRAQMQKDAKTMQKESVKRYMKFIRGDIEENG